MMLDRLGFMAAQRVLGFRAISYAVNELFVSVVAGRCTTAYCRITRTQADMIIMKDRRAQV